MKDRILEAWLTAKRWAKAHSPIWIVRRDVTFYPDGDIMSSLDQRGEAIQQLKGFRAEETRAQTDEWSWHHYHTGAAIVIAWKRRD